MGQQICSRTLELLEKPVSAAQVAIAFAVMSDRPSEELDMVAIHGLSSGMYKSGQLFDHAVMLNASGRAKRIAVMGGDGRATGGNVSGAAWIGSKAMIQQLVVRGVDLDEIIVLDPITHSKEEALAIVKLTKERNFRRVGSVSAAYHGGRMLSYMVAAMKELNYWIDYRMLPPASTDWWLEILGSQGQAITNCFESALADTLKIEEHIQRGFAAPFSEVVYYLRNRQEIVESQVWDYPG